MYFVDESGNKKYREEVKENYEDAPRDAPQEDSDGDKKISVVWIILAVLVGAIVIGLIVHHMRKSSPKMSYGSSSEMEANFGFRFY